ncbi:MAG: hypothetical protein IJ141_06695 [Lachnospiraceae bacterium]|nr:hypothetical protein [Lachnospiraceae bacterium]
MVVLPLLFFVLFNFTIVIISKKSFGKCLPVSMIMATFIVYLSQFLFHTFNIGIYIIEIIALADIPCFVLKKNKSEYKKLLFSMGFISFVTIYLFYMIVDYNRHFVTFDEWYHWGMMVKEMIRLDKFYSVVQSNLHIHKDYPPFISILEMIFCKMSGGYSEAKISMALHIFTLSFILPWLLEKINIESIKFYKKIIISISCIFLLLSIILIFDPWWARISTTILVDIVIAVVFSYSFLTVWFMDKLNIFDVISLVLANSAMIMIKQVCLGFLIIIGFLYAIKCIYSTNKFNWGLSWLIIMGIPLINYKIWGLYVSKLGIVGQFDMKAINIKRYIGILMGNEQGIERETLMNYFRALFQKPINSLEWFPITYVSASLLIYASIVFLIIRFKDSFEKKSAAIIGIVFTCGTIGYAFMMSVLYLFCFNKVEMKNLASYDRYMASYVLGEVLVLIIIYIMIISKKNETFWSIKKLFLITFVCMFLNSDNIFYMAPQMLRENTHKVYEDYANYLKKRVEPGSKVFIIYDAEKTDQNWYGPMQIYINYYDNDLVVDYNFNDAFVVDLSDESIKEKVVDEILKNDYLYVINVNDNINSNLGSLSECAFINNTVYRIDKEYGISFIRID